MAQTVAMSIQQEIARREKELDSLREALRLVGGGGGGSGSGGGSGGGGGGSAGVGRGRGPRGPKTEAQKRKISLALKKAWARRKKADTAAA